MLEQQQELLLNNPPAHKETAAAARPAFWERFESIPISYLQGATVYLIAFLVGATILFTPEDNAFLSTDDYYHARAAEQIVLQRTVNLDFPWLPLSIISPERFVNHHLLFHMYLSVPVYLGGITGAKLAQAGLLGGVVLAMYVMMRGLGVRYAFIWSLGAFAISWTFIFRMLMLRVPAPSLMMMIFGLHFMFQRKHRLLILLSFLFVWLYTGFVLLIGLALLYGFSKLIVNRTIDGSYSDRLAQMETEYEDAGRIRAFLIRTFHPLYERFANMEADAAERDQTPAMLRVLYIIQYGVDWKPIIYTLVGIGLGLVINPFFPNNIIFWWENVGPKLNLEDSVPLGAEWYPLNTRVFMQNAIGSIAALGLGFLRFSFDGAKRDRPSITLLIFAFLLMALAFNSLRWLEYFPAFALLFFASTWGRGEANIFEHPLYHRYKRVAAPIVLIAGIAFFTFLTLPNVYRAAGGVDPRARLQGAAEWLEANTPEGSIVFASGFNDFSRMFFYNQHNTYVIGLDPTYMSLVFEDGEQVGRERWDTYYDIIKGRVDNPGPVIQETFGSAYAVSTHGHHDFNRKAVDDPNMRLVFRDDINVVFEIRNSDVTREIVEPLQ